MVSATRTGLLLYTAYNVAATAASFPAGRLSDRIGNTRVLQLGIALFLAAYIGVRHGHRQPGRAAERVLAGLGIGCCETAEHAAVAGLAPEDLRGSAFGLLAGIQSAGNLAASAVAGLIWTIVGPSAAFAYLCAFMAAALAILTFRRATSRQAGAA